MLPLLACVRWRAQTGHDVADYQTDQQEDDGHENEAHGPRYKNG